MLLALLSDSNYCHVFKFLVLNEYQDNLLSKKYIFAYMHA